MNNEISVAVIGAGYWGPNLVRNFSRVDGCRISHICDLDQGRLDAIRNQYVGVTYTQDAVCVMTDPQVDLVAIATPVSSHHSLARAALSAGKHVLLEKPMASSVAECEDLIGIAKTHNRMLFVDHTFLFTGAVRKIKELVDQGQLGTPHYYDSERINLGLIQPDIDVLWDLAPHDLSILGYIFPDAKPVRVHASGTSHVNGRTAEMAHIVIAYDTGLVGHIHVSWLSPVKIRKTLIGGDKKMILFNDIDPSEKIRVYDKGVSYESFAETPLRPVYRSGDVVIPKLDTKEALHAEAEHIVDCLFGRAKPMSDGAGGLGVVQLLEAAKQSLMVQGRAIYL